MHDPPAVFSDVRLVGHQDDRDALLHVQSLEDAHDLGAGLGIQVAGRLVGQDDARLVDQRPRDGDALLLPAGQLVGPMVDAVAQPYRLQGALGPLPPLRGRAPE